MKAIIIYETEDGCRFDKKEDAIKYEELCDKCNEIESRLVNIDRDLKYNEYIQQDVNVVKNAYNWFYNKHNCKKLLYSIKPLKLNYWFTEEEIKEINR